MGDAERAFRVARTTSENSYSANVRHIGTPHAAHQAHFGTFIAFLSRLELIEASPDALFGIVTTFVALGVLA